MSRLAYLHFDYAFQTEFGDLMHFIPVLTYHVPSPSVIYDVGGSSSDIG